MASFLQGLGNAIDYYGRKLNAVGIKPPELGISEYLAPKAYAQTTTTNWQNPNDPKFASGNAFQAYVNAGGSGNGSSNNYNIPSTATNSNNSYNTGISNIQQQQDTGNSQIEADYNQAMSQLGGAESGLRSQAANASSQIDTGALSATNDINNSQAVAEQGVNSTLSTAQQQAKTASMQARDLFRQTQNQNNAQLSALGLSSSSVAEALAEKLGVETARRIAGVTDNLNTIQLNARQELGRVKTYYQGQIQALNQHVQDQKAQVQSALIQGLNQINSSRGQAAHDKAAARANLLSQVQNSIYQLTAQQQQFQQSLDQWAAQKAAALTPVATDPEYVAKQAGNLSYINSSYAPSGFQYVPQINAQGQVTGYALQKKVKVDENGYPVNDPNSGLGAPSNL